MSAQSSPLDASQLDAATQRELQSFIEQEQSRARLQTSIHEFTSKCWDLCITGSIGARFSSKEGSCLMNCVDRFIDTSQLIVKNLEQRQGGGH